MCELIYFSIIKSFFTSSVDNDKRILIILNNNSF